jgi:RNA recognition motif-containing protein
MNIYVSNIPFKMKDEELLSLFSEFGEVTSSKIIVDKFTQRSRGFGFVEMPDEVAQSAIDGLNGREVMGLQLRVNEARPKTEGFRDNSRGFGGNTGGGGGGYKKREY